MARHRVLIATQDRVGPEMAGPAIRAVEFARSLAREHEVAVIAPQHADYDDSSVAVLSYTSDRELLRALEGYDILVTSGSLLEQVPALHQTSRFVVADLYDPAIFEALAFYESAPMRHQIQIHRGALRELAANLRRADTVLCASERQRHLLVGMLTVNGRVNPATYANDPTLDGLVRVVPFGIPAPPKATTRPGPLRTRLRLNDSDVLVVWGGGIYQWLDPLTLVEALADMNNSVKAFFLGTDHPTPSTPAMPVGYQARARAEELGLLNRTVFFGEGWVPYEERASYLLDADVGISLHRQHIESTFAFRTRLLDYVWAGLPMVISDGDSWANLVRDRGLGIVVAPGDVAGTRNALLRLADRDMRSTCATSVRAIADDFRWDKVIYPLMEFCRHPERAADLLRSYRRLRTGVEFSERLHAALVKIRRSMTAPRRRRQ